MTVARIALRLAVVQALTGTKDARPTIAQGRVYDSRIAPENPEVFGDDAKPTVIVLTDADEGEALSDQNGGPPFKRLIDLVLDIGMVAQEAPPAEDGSYSVFYPDTDARLETSLDVLEAQIMRQLCISTDPLALWFQNHVRIWKRESHRQVEDNSAMKMARRLTTLTCQLNDDVPDLLAIGETPADGIAGLPEPLATVAALMPDGSYGAEICAGIVSELPQITPQGVTFKGVDLTIDAGDPPRGSKVDGDNRQVNAKADTGQND